MLGALVASVALAALASAAVASPALSPVPSECGGCESAPFNFTLSSGSTTMESEVGSWKYASGSGAGNVEAGGTSIGEAHVTLQNGTNECSNEGHNLAISNLHGKIGFVASNGAAGLVLEPNGSGGPAFAKCTQLGAAAEVTGSIIGSISPTNTPTTSFSVNYSASHGVEEFNTFEGEEPLRGLSISYNGNPPGPLGVLESTTLTTSAPVELNTTGGASRFITHNPGGSKPTGGFVLAGKSMKLLSKNGNEVMCKATWAHGEFTSATAGHLLLDFTKCTGPLGVKCQSAHAQEKEIYTAGLKAQLVYTDPAKEVTGGRETAVLLTPETGSVFAEFTCGTVKSVVTGSVLAVISPLGTPSNTFGLTLKQSKAKEEVKTYEGTGGAEANALLQMSTAEGKFEESGLEMSPTVQLAGGAVETIK
jgi:hypothetical protein